jgi:hypothetical protein
MLIIIPVFDLRTMIHESFNVENSESNGLLPQQQASSRVKRGLSVLGIHSEPEGDSTSLPLGNSSDSMQIFFPSREPDQSPTLGLNPHLEKAIRELSQPL